MAQRYPVIAREGWIPIAFFAVVGLYAFDHWNAVVAVLSWCISVILAFYFRDPPRRIPPSPLAVLSPADGRVLAVGPVHDEPLGREAILVRIAMRPMGVFAVRSPIEGKVMRQWIPEGEGAGVAQWVQSDEHDDVVLVALPRAPGARAFCDVQSGERIGQGQRCGFLPLGAELQVVLPVASRVMVQPGDRVQSGVSVIAKLVRK